MTIQNDLQLLKNYLHEIYQNNIKQAWHDDRIKLKVDFACLVDGLQKDNDISEKTSNNFNLFILQIKSYLIFYIVMPCFYGHAYIEY